MEEQTNVPEKSGKKIYLKFIHFIPLIVVAALAAVILPLYLVTAEKIKGVTVAIICVTVFIPLVFPLYSAFAKKDAPWIIVALVCVHITFSNFLGSAMDFYQRFFWWDLLMHGLFGFTASLAAYYVLSFSTLKPISKIILAFAVTMALAALWEVFEFTSDQITGGDAQRVEQCIKEGKSPVSDTMEDIMIAGGGFIIFALLAVIDKFTHGKMADFFFKKNKT